MNYTVYNSYTDREYQFKNFNHAHTFAIAQMSDRNVKMVKIMCCKWDVLLTRTFNGIQEEKQF